MKTLNVLAVADPAITGIVSEKDRFDAFEKEHGIKLNMDVLPWAEYYPALLASFETYQYDVVMVAGHLWLYDFVSNGYLREIDDGYSNAYEYEDVLETVREEIEIDGKHYLFPSFCDGHMLLYRKSAFYRELPEKINLEEVMQLVKATGENSFTLKAHQSEIFQDILPYFRNEGVEPFDENGHINLDTPEAVTALKNYIEMKNYCAEDVANFGNEEVMRAIQKKECVIGVTWSGQLGSVMNDDCEEPEDVGFCALATSWNVTWSFGMNALCKDYEAAKLFMEFVTGKEMDQRAGFYSGNPVRKSTFKAGINDNAWYAKVLEMIKGAKPVAKSKKTGAMMGIIAQNVHDAFTGKITPENAMKNAQKECEAIK